MIGSNIFRRKPHSGRGMTLLILAVLLGLADARGILAQSDTVRLPKPGPGGAVSVEQAIQNRRSVRNFRKKNPGPGEISRILWAAQGITDPADALRASPSAGAIYPVEIYLLDANGRHLYLPGPHSLKRLGSADIRIPLAAAALGQLSVRDAPFSIVICGIPDKIRSKYGDRGMRYLFMEAGHIAQNIHLQAVALGMGSVPIGAFDDGKVGELLKLPGGQIPLYIIPVGYPESGRREK